MKALEDKFNQQMKKPKEQRSGKISAGIPADAVVKTISVSLRKVEYEFWGQRFSFNTIGMFLLAFTVGIVGGTYGIGGGAIIAPFCVAVFRPADLYGRGCGAHGHIYYLHRRSFLLQYDTGRYGAADRAGLAPGSAVWFRGLLWNVHGRPASKIRSSKIHKAHAGYFRHLRCGSLHLAILAVKTAVPRCT